ncbi:hypothetical protein TNCV_1600211 [Trichonephila clavipes]|nr:hypothetical protein TNCV_1600211 [Trichonephila clavipes]
MLSLGKQKHDLVENPALCHSVFHITLARYHRKWSHVYCRFNDNILTGHHECKTLTISRWVMVLIGTLDSRNKIARTRSTSRLAAKKRRVTHFPSTALFEELANSGINIIFWLFLLSVVFQGHVTYLVAELTAQINGFWKYTTPEFNFFENKRMNNRNIFSFLNFTTLLSDAMTTKMPDNFDYFYDIIDIFDDGPVVRGATLTSNMPERIEENKIKPMKPNDHGREIIAGVINAEYRTRVLSLKIRRVVGMINFISVEAQSTFMAWCGSLASDVSAKMSSSSFDHDSE